ncbi:acyl carrier protein [Actinokineospora sp. NPDC004072]
MSTTEQVATPEQIRANLAEFVEKQTRQAVTTDVDLFASGMVSSLFALQLVVHVESAFGVAVGGPDLKLDNFRTIDTITELVLRLRG